MRKRCGDEGNRLGRIRAMHVAGAHTCVITMSKNKCQRIKRTRFTCKSVRYDTCSSLTAATIVFFAPR